MGSNYTVSAYSNMNKSVEKIMGKNYHIFFTSTVKRVEALTNIPWLYRHFISIFCLKAERKL